MGDTLNDDSKRIVVVAHQQPHFPQFLYEEGFIDSLNDIEVINRPRPRDVHGAHVFAITLPLFLAAYASKVTLVGMMFKEAYRDRVLTTTEMADIAFEPRTYRTEVMG